MMNSNSELLSATILQFVSDIAPDLVKFWENGDVSAWVNCSLQDHADYIYVKYFLRQLNTVEYKSVVFFAEQISTLPLTGRTGRDNHLLPHLSAYLLGALNLLDDIGFNVRSSVLSNIELDFGLMIDQRTNLPLWPNAWSHHTWRVSHWIGGIPSVLLTFARHKPSCKFDEGLVRKILESIDSRVIVPSSGLMKAYSSQLIQKVFRLLYKIRHNPEHGDIGGLVHIHWVNHVLERKYIAGGELIDRSLQHLEGLKFLESAPYCLDFDYVQLLRTASAQNADYRDSEISIIMENYIENTTSFLNCIPKERYTLHKLVGALATLEEAMFYTEDKNERIDIIKKAYWL